MTIAEQCCGLKDCSKKTRFAIKISYLFIHFVVMVFSFIPWCYCTPELLYPKDTLHMTQLALTNEEVVNLE